MKIYIVAAISDIYMLPIDSKIYKSRKGAEKALSKYLEKYPHKKNGTKVLVADNWHSEAE